jgi:DNA-binding LacI/PurR family transcriptional regulator
MFFPEVIRGIVTQATRSAYDLMITTGITEREELDAVMRLVKGRRVDGILLLHSRKQDPIVCFLREQRFPFVLVGRSEDFSDILSVDNDNAQASYDATSHLISQGHKRIGFVSGPPNLIVSKDRLEGYMRALNEAGLESHPEWIVEGEFLQESGYRAMSFFMSLPERPTALVVIDDVVALGVVRGLTELGYKVPNDLSVVGFNNIQMAELSTPPLSSVDIGVYQIGYTASQALIRRIKGESTMQPRMIIPHRLVVRESSFPRRTE